MKSKLRLLTIIFAILCAFNLSSIKAHAEDDISFEEDTVIDHDLTLTGGSVYLNGYTLTVDGDLTIQGDPEIYLGGGTLTVTGNLYQQGGTMRVDHGDLDVAGNYYIAGAGSVFTQGNESYVPAYGYLKMENEDDEVHIGGNFAVATAYSYYNDNHLSDGTMYLGGDFRQVCEEGTDGCSSNFNAANSHRVVFNGSEKQTISFDSSDSGFNLITFENSDVEIAGKKLRVFSLDSDVTLTIAADAPEMTGEMWLNEHTLTVDGDLTINGDPNIYLNSGTLKVTGTLYQQGGTIHTENGKLDVDGNYYLAGEGSDFTPGNESYVPADSYLKMENEDGEVHVGGDFAVATAYSYYSDNRFTAGTMYIGGDFRQTFDEGASIAYPNNFDASDSHRVVFNGSEKQTVWFDSSSSGFNLVTFENSNVEFAGKCLRVFALESDLTLAVAADAPEMAGEMWLNEHTLTVDGDLTINGDPNIYLNSGTLKVTGTLFQQGGTIYTENGKLDVDGNYYLAGEGSDYTPGNESYVPAYSYLKMENEDGEVHVAGDFAVASYSNYNNFSAGTMYIGGNFRQAYEYGMYASSGNFDAYDYHRVVFNGSEKQTVWFDSSDSGFNQVTFENSDIEIAGKCLRGITLNDDITLTVSTETLFMAGTMDLSGHTLSVTTGDSFTVNGGETYFNEGNLVVNGNLALEGYSYLNLSGGTMTVTGTLFQQNGTMELDNGTLNVGENYYLAGEGSDFTPGNESYVPANSYLRMDDEDDEVHVGGDFAVASYYGDNIFSAGTMYIGGDFRQAYEEGSYGSPYNFDPGSDYRLVFNGSERQAIWFDNYQSGFNNVTFENSDIELKGNYLRGFTLNDDISLTVSTGLLNISGTMDLNGHSIGAEINDSFAVSGGEVYLGGENLAVNGDLTLKGYTSLHLGGGTLTVGGTLFQQDGTVDVDHGTLNVGSNYYLAGDGSVFTPGNESYVSSDSYLKMENEDDEVHVGGDFVIASHSYYHDFSAGTMYIGGNFRHAYEEGNYGSSYSFDAGENYKVVFNGSGRQSIRFDSYDSGFGDVVFENSDIELKGSYLRGLTLNDDINLTLSTDTLNIMGTIDLNGHSIGMDTINGDFTVNGGSVKLSGHDLTINGKLTATEGDLELGGAELTVNGDLVSKRNINLDGGVLTVGGTLYQHDGMMTLGGGTLNIAENYYIAGEGSVFTAGNESYVSAYGGLLMENEYDEVHVGGDFAVVSGGSYYNTLTAGIMYIGGNFRQAYEYSSYGYSNNFDSCYDHKVVFNGSGRQSIRFDSCDSGFNEVTFENSDIELKGNFLRGFTLNDDISLTMSTNTLYVAGMMDLNRHSIGMDTISGNFTVSGGEVYLRGEDLEVNGDLTLEGYSYLYLGGGMLTVTGNLYQHSGGMILGGGLLDIGGNYYLAGEGSEYTPGRESYVSSGSYLEMSYANDEVRVGGDFVTASNNYNDLSAGTMYIGGGFRQVNGSYYSSNFDSNGTHKVVFNGSGRQTIQFDSCDSGFNEVTFENSDIELKGNNLRGFTLNDDISLTLPTNTLYMSGTMDLNGHSIGIDTISGNFTVNGGTVRLSGNDLTINGKLTAVDGSLELNGAELTVTGDIVSKKDIYLDSGTLSVAGTLYQQSGTMDVGAGVLDIGGNYYLAGENSSFREGRESYETSHSYLDMTNENGEVHVGGNFAIASYYYYNDLSAGTMYIGGNFRQVNGSYSSNFDSNGTHKVVFNGSGRQTIQFDSCDSGFSEVAFENSDIELKGSNLRGFTLNDDISLTLSTNTLNMSGTMDLNGHSIGMDTISGNFTVNGGTVKLGGYDFTINGKLTATNGGLELGGADLTVTGDMVSKNGISLENGTLSVAGTLYQQSGTMDIGAGVLDIGGNYYLAGENSSFREGREAYETSYSYLDMTDENGEVHVGGNFAIASYNYYNNDLSAGTIYIAGDFRDANRCFWAHDTHKVVLNRKGKAKQTARFDSYDENHSHFNILELTRTKDHYIFIPDPCWVTLIEADPPVFGEPDFVLPASLKQIDEEAFEGIDAKIVDVPGTCTDIGAHAFRGSSIEQIRIPAGCAIEEDAFDGCEFVLVFGTVGSPAQAYCDTHDNCEFWEQ